MIKRVDIAASEVSRTAKVRLGWVRRCDAWEGRMWVIHPWTGGVNQQVIKHGTNSLVMVGTPWAVETCLIALRQLLFILW